MKKILFSTFIFALTSVMTLQAQVTIGQNVEPDKNAVLELRSNGNRGLLLPRVVLTDTVAVAPLAAPVPAGMMVYNTTASADGKVSEGVYFYDGRRWWLTNGGGHWFVSGTKNSATLNTDSIYQSGRVTIGRDTIQSLTMLNVYSEDKGIMIPRLTEEQRDLIPVDSLANSLMIYNTTEDCYNYYSKSEGEWQSLCGKMGKAVIDKIDCNSIQVFGSYIQGVQTTINERLVIPIVITKPGSWDATATAMYDATTPNGYVFTGNGTFLFTGPQTITLTAQGTPTQAHYSATPPPIGDNVQIRINGTDYACNDFIIPVTPASANYNILCGSAKVYGVYTMLPDLTNSDDETHYIEVNVNVVDTQGGLATGWSGETNRVSGLQFRGSGSFSATGTQTIRLYAVAGSKATSLDPIVLTMTFQTKNGEAQCQVTARAAFTRKKILALSETNTGYGYSAQAGASRRLLMSAANFGTNLTSTVPMITTGSTGAAVGAGNPLPSSGVKYNYNAFDFTFYSDFTAANLQRAINEKFDIVILGYAHTWTTAIAQVAFEYMSKGGIILDFCENTSPSIVLNAIFGTSTIAGSADGTPMYAPMANFPDPLLNGPFQPAGSTSLGGFHLGGDYETRLYGFSRIPASGVIVYAYTGAGNPVALRTVGQNYVLFGEGGFLCNDDNGSWLSSSTEPFATTRDITPGDTSYRPAPRPAQGTGTGALSVPIYNSFFFANAMAWAVEQAQFNGINTR